MLSVQPLTLEAGGFLRFLLAEWPAPVLLRSLSGGESTMLTASSSSQLSLSALAAASASAWPQSLSLSLPDAACAGWSSVSDSDSRTCLRFCFAAAAPEISAHKVQKRDQGLHLLTNLSMSVYVSKQQCSLGV